MNISLVRSFADDTRLIKSVLNISDASNLQADLNSVYELAGCNNMMFNDIKLEALRYGKDDVLQLCTNYTSSSGSIINDAVTVKDLGILIEFRSRI